MDKSLLNYIESLIGGSIEACHAVSGGDIANTYRLHTGTEVLFCKYHTGKQAFDMFQSEKDGLEALSRGNIIKTPEVFICEPWQEAAFLIMEFVPSGRAKDSAMAVLGRQLAQLHIQECSSFGWNRNNFIGSLPQSNNRSDSWAEFYMSERLQPQFKIAFDQGLLSRKEIPSTEKMSAVIVDLCGEVKPSLLHGDLWGGNYLISEAGVPYLIDPAVYEGHGEVDIAMSKLFGGFGPHFYRGYEEIIPFSDYTHDRIKIYQLYYLLVHLNLFGASYYSSVKAILKSYF